LGFCYFFNLWFVHCLTILDIIFISSHFIHLFFVIRVSCIPIFFWTFCYVFFGFQLFQWSLDLTFFWHFASSMTHTYHQMFNCLGFHFISSIFFPIFSLFSNFHLSWPTYHPLFFSWLQIIWCLIFMTRTSIFQILNIFFPYFIPCI
jgi:hypothetical protein